MCEPELALASVSKIEQVKMSRITAIASNKEAAQTWQMCSLIGYLDVDSIKPKGAVSIFPSPLLVCVACVARQASFSQSH